MLLHSMCVAGGAPAVNSEAREESYPEALEKKPDYAIFDPLNTTVLCNESWFYSSRPCGNRTHFGNERNRKRGRLPERRGRGRGCRTLRGTSCGSRRGGRLSGRAASGEKACRRT